MCSLTIFSMRILQIYKTLYVVLLLYFFDINKSEVLYAFKSSNFTIKCPFKSINETVVWTGPPNMKTYSDKRIINSEVKDIGIVGDIENGEYNLIIYGFDESNEGDYQCTSVFDKMSAKKDYNVMLQIRKPILSIRISPSESVIMGTNVSFECTAKSNPSPFLLRLYGPDGNVLKTRSMRISDDTMMLCFTTSDIMSKELGNYTCVAENSIANGTATVWINILYPPRVTIAGRNYSDSDSVRRLDCVADGNPSSYRYTAWEHSYYGQHIRNLRGYENGTLILPYIDKTEHRHEDSGSYKCFVGNDIPKSNFYQTAEIFIQITGRPVFLRRNHKTHYAKYGESINILFYIYSIPDVTSVQHVITTQEKCHATIEFGTKKQQVTDTFHNKNVQLLADVVTFRIPVNNSDDYFTNYTIEAKNKNGKSRFTFQLIETICYCPDIPIIKRVSPGTNSVKLVWSSRFNGGFPQTFFIEYKQASQEKWFGHTNITDTNKSNYSTVISDLLPNELYDVRMYAVNIMNRSQFTNVFKVKTGGDASSSIFSYLPVYITIGLVLFVITFASVGYCRYTSGNCNGRHKHSANRNSGQEEGNASFNNIDDINENRPPTLAGIDAASVVYSHSSREEVLGADYLACRALTNQQKSRAKQPLKQELSQLNYIELDLNPSQQGHKLYIHGKDNRTEYSEINFSINGDPLKWSDSETDDESDTDRIDCIEISN